MSFISELALYEVTDIIYPTSFHGNNLNEKYGKNSQIWCQDNGKFLSKISQKSENTNEYCMKSKYSHTHHMVC